MGFFDWIKGKKKKSLEKAYTEIETDLEQGEILDAHKAGHFAIDHCEHIIELTRELEDSKAEYKIVTAYLNDVELISDLPEDEGKLIAEAAENVIQLGNKRDEYLHTAKKMSDAQFLQMEKEEKEIPDAIKRLSGNEKYLDVLERDIHYLEGEKFRWDENSHDIRKEQKKLKNLSMVLFGVAVMAAAIILVFQVCFEMDMLLVWLITIFVLAMGSLYDFVKMQSNVSELKQSDVNLNHAINLLNKVKIKYVNIKNAVDYACEKYHVRHSGELNQMWELYMEAVREKEKYMQTNDDLEYFNGKLIRTLKKYPLYDAKVWITQAQALVDPREMVEIKHNLIQRRQKLRSRMEYNMEQIKNERADLNRLLEKEPEGKQEIQEIVKSIDKLCGINE